MILKHTAIHDHRNLYFNLYETMKEGGTIDQWVSLVEKSAATLTDENEERQGDIQNNLRGNMLEIFAEIFFHTHEHDERVGIKDYTPVPLGEDYGVDAVGINVAGDKCAVQVKYRGNLTEQVFYKDLAKTCTDALLYHDVPIKEKNSVIFLVTTGAGANHIAKNRLGRKLVIIDREFLRRCVDNNKSFWGTAYNTVYDTLDNKQGDNDGN